MKNITNILPIIISFLCIGCIKPLPESLSEHCQYYIYQSDSGHCELWESCIMPDGRGWSRGGGLNSKYTTSQQYVKWNIDKFTDYCEYANPCDLCCDSLRIKKQWLLDNEHIPQLLISHIYTENKQWDVDTTVFTGRDADRFVLDFVSKNHQSIEIRIDTCGNYYHNLGGLIGYYIGEGDYYMNNHTYQAAQCIKGDNQPHRIKY